MKYILTCLLLIFHCTYLFPQTLKNNNPVKYIPGDVSFVLYLNSLDKAFNEFKRSYFWRKYKLTKKGKGLGRILESIDASFLIFGLTLNSLLEIFSQQAFLGIWLENNNVIKDYIYLIEKKKNKSKINAIVEQLQFFAVANKINLQKYKQNSFNIINFTDQLYIADNNDFVLISNNRTVLNKICNNIQNKIVAKHNIMDFEKYFKNKNFVFYLQTANIAISKSAVSYYSFRFNNKPELEILYKDNKGTYTNQFKFENEYFKMLPRDINFVYLGNIDIREIIYPFFTLVGTNLYSLDKKYFDAYFSELDINQKYSQLTAAKISSTTTNILRIIDIKLQTNGIYTAGSNVAVYLNTKIYNNEQGYYVFIKNKLIISRQLNFLKNAIQSYKRKSGFYYTKDFKKILTYKNKKFILWMDLRKYIYDVSKKYKKELWAHYNAYLKTFNKMMIYSNKKDTYIYMKLFFY